MEILRAAGFHRMVSTDSQHFPADYLSGGGELVVSFPFRSHLNRGGAESPPLAMSENWPGRDALIGNFRGRRPNPRSSVY